MITAKAVEIEFDPADLPTPTVRSILEDRGCTVLDPGEDPLDHADTDSLIAELGKRGYTVGDPDSPSDLGAWIERRHSEQHKATILTCTDEVRDAYTRLGGQS